MAAGETPARRKPPEILVIEDDEMNTLLFRDLLESRGYRVGAVADGDAALARLEKSTPDLIVLDIVIRGTNGFELLKLLKKTAAWRDIPVMVVSGLPPDTYRQPIMKAGCDAFIAKPMSITTFLSAVAHLVSARPKATAASARLARCLDPAAPAEGGAAQPDQTPDPEPGAAGPHLRLVNRR